MRRAFVVETNISRSPKRRVDRGIQNKYPTFQGFSNQLSNTTHYASSLTWPLGLAYPFFALAQAPVSDTLLIDFGNNPSPVPWNNIADPAAGQVADLTNAAGFASAYGLAIFDPFNNINTNGATDPDQEIGFPATATTGQFTVELTTESRGEVRIQLFDLLGRELYRQQDWLTGSASQRITVEAGGLNIRGQYLMCVITIEAVGQLVRRAVPLVLRR